VKYNDI